MGKYFILFSIPDKCHNHTWELGFFGPPDHPTLIEYSKQVKMSQNNPNF